MVNVRFLIFSLLLCLVSSCKKEDKNPCQAAEQYYGYLIKGNVEAYVRHIHDYDQMDEGYRSQLKDMFLQYLDREEQIHGGIVSARALRDTLIDSVEAHVFVEVQFGDSTSEQVSLPLVRTPKGWMMR